MACTVIGALNWTGSRSAEGVRSYKVKWLVKSNSVHDGPAQAITASGLSPIGSYWNPGNDYDVWAFCTPAISAAPLYQKERSYYWVVDQNFTTKPRERCQDASIENPLDEPPEISGGFSNYQKEAVKDRNDKDILTSSHEIIRGAAVEFDDNRANISITKNVLCLPLATFTDMINTVNDATMWGLPKRTIKLSNVSWSRVLYGTCAFYFTVTYDFDIDFETFDRTVIDEGTRVLTKGGDKNNKNDFEVYKDVNGENTRVFLDGAGSALGDGADPVEIDIEYYKESNFLTLGIPSTLSC
tara:strand:- start:13932 stop:14825 length:894 start_codon:yes stop_codon:yes gene_type:complete